jgi:acylphosphatase
MGEREAPDRVRAHVWVSGQVQGVFFRAYAEDEAAHRETGVWIRNAPDGLVVAVFEGAPEAVAAMIQWCHRGSPAARVAGVQIVWEPLRGERGFRIRD